MYQSITQLLEDAPLWAANGSSATINCVSKAEAMNQAVEDQDEWAAAIAVDIEERAIAGCRRKRPARMLLTAILLIVWSLLGTAWQSGNWIAGVSVTEAKNTSAAQASSVDQAESAM